MKFKTYAPLFILCCTLIVSGCSQVYPFIDSRREAGQKETVGASKPEAPVVCYGLFGEEADRDQLANEECAKQGKKAVFKEKNYFSCKLFTPARAFYECVDQ